MFDPVFYKNFHLDIKVLGWSEKQLRESYEKYGKKEGRWCCEADFYQGYPDFDLEFYTNYYPDLNILNEDKYMIMRHYIDFGKNEGRLINSRQLTIPKTIYMCHKNLKDIKLYSQNWKRLNPEWEIKLYDNDLCKQFLLEEYSQLHCDIFNFLKDLTGFLKNSWKTL